MGWIIFKQRGWVLGLALLMPGMATATETPKVVNLQIQTAEGKSLQAPVRWFKGLSFGVVATLVKQGKMKGNPQGVGANGDMTFLLDKSVTEDFVKWAQGALTQKGGQTGATGTFVWTDSKGKVSETFTLKGVKVMKFTPDPKNAYGGTLVLEADETTADPPLNFNPKK
jgi:hypothetical protein